MNGCEQSPLASMRDLPSIYMVLGGADQLGKLPGTQHPHLLRLSTPRKTDEFL